MGRTLGPAGRGFYSFGLYCLAIGVSVGDGIRAAFAYESGRANPASARVLWGGALTLVAATGGLASCACVALAIRDPGQPSYPFLAVVFPAVIYAQVVNLLWSMHGRIETLNVRNIITIGGGSNLVSVAALLAVHASLHAIFIIWTCAFVAAAVWSSFGVRSFLGGMPAWPDLVTLREQSGFAAKATLSSLTTFLARRIDVFIVAALVSPREYGVYTVSVATAEVMYQVSNAISWAAMGRMASLDHDGASELVARMVRSLLAVQTLGAVCLFVAGPWLIVAVYGAKFADAGLPLRVMLPGIVCYSADQLLSFFISVRTGRPGLLLGFEALSAAICGIATAYGVTHFGIAGAAGANTLTYLVSFVLKTGYFARVGKRGMREILIARWSDAPDRLRALLTRGPKAAT